MSKITKILFSIIMVIIISNCSRPIKNTRNIKELDFATPVGSPFNKSLTEQYNKLSLLFANDYLARKGLAANDGIFVQPEVITHFRYKTNNRDVLEKTEARARLMHALENDARLKAPYEIAVAQAHFDCWVLDLKYKEDRFINRKFKREQKASRPFSCKAQFIDAIRLAEQKTNYYQHDLDAPEEPEPYMMPSISSVARRMRGKGQMANIDNAMFLTFFDWDKDTVSPAALKILDSIAAEIKSRKDINKVILVGHTDTSGDRNYNQNLSVRRAINVSYALIDRGINHKMIHAEGKGQTQLLVPTPDNVREPSNRRVAISFE